MKHNTHKPLCRFDSAYRMQPAVHPGWRPAVPTRMEMTKTIQPAAPGGWFAPTGNWCHLFTPLRGKGFLHTTDHDFLKMMAGSTRFRAVSLSNATDHDFWQETAELVALRNVSLYGKKQLSRQMDVCYAQVQAGIGFAGKRLKSRGRYRLKAQKLLMGWVSPTNFWTGCGLALTPSSSSFHPANLEGVSSRCTL